MLNEAENAMLNYLLPKLEDIDVVTVALQSEEVNMSHCRDLLDSLLERFEFEQHIGLNAPRILNSDFENKENEQDSRCHELINLYKTKQNFFRL